MFTTFSEIDGHWYYLHSLVPPTPMKPAADPDSQVHARHPASGI